MITGRDETSHVALSAACPGVEGRVEGGSASGECPARLTASAAPGVPGSSSSAASSLAGTTAASASAARSSACAALATVVAATRLVGSACSLPSCIGSPASAVASSPLVPPASADAVQGRRVRVESRKQGSTADSCWQHGCVSLVRTSHQHAGHVANARP